MGRTKKATSKLEAVPTSYVQESTSNHHLVEGVSTSIALFIGRAKKGPRSAPVLCSSLADFEREFSLADVGSDLARSLKLFFANGGARCYVLRLGGTRKTPPKLADYRAAFNLADKEIDLFNLLVLPKDRGHDAGTRAGLWGPASEFCQKRRAFLLVDPPEAWSTVAEALDPVQGVAALRAGLATENCALYFPQVLVVENGAQVALGASGLMAGLMARIDTARGVWKSPAGTEADLRGVAGLALPVSDGEHGLLNAQGVNALRVMPQGLRCWGARTLAGAGQGGDYVYVAVKRMALFLEESLARGLSWTVFEPNDQTLWSQLALLANAFLESLFRQGAFVGSARRKPFSPSAMPRPPRPRTAPEAM
ncbi:MAG: phage tail sheath family protein [Candidatus Firestonebacteria bacterium]|nr:phage tail sheath family protein [Candidatus Firestonebacteria bacterium]